MAEPRRRLLPHLASLLLKYSYIISMVCYAAGLVTVLLLPALAKSTYISENALMPGSANPVFGAREAADAIRMADEVQSLVLKHADGYM
jgi:glycosylphosphatidylinositol transamidase